VIGQAGALAKGGRDRDVGYDTQRGEVQLHEVGCGPAAGGWTDAILASTWSGASALAVHTGSMARECTHSVLTLGGSLRHSCRTGEALSDGVALRGGVATREGGRS
jgi:hypothetical protein